MGRRSSTHRVGEARWCPEWWRHTAAIMRLEPGAGVSIWILHHTDPQMTALTHPQGPLKGCSIDRGHDPERAIASSPASEGIVRSSGLIIYRC